MSFSTKIKEFAWAINRELSINKMIELEIFIGYSFIMCEWFWVVGCFSREVSAFPGREKMQIFFDSKFNFKRGADSSLIACGLVHKI